MMYVGPATFTAMSLRPPQSSNVRRPGLPFWESSCPARQCRWPQVPSKTLIFVSYVLMHVFSRNVPSKSMVYQMSGEVCSTPQNPGDGEAIFASTVLPGTLLPHATTVAAKQLSVATESVQRI